MLDYSKKEAHIVKANKKLVDELLALNNNNRSPRKSHIKWLQQSIADKEFILTGQGVSVSESGVLIDGQHRLMAIREAGYPPVEFLLVTGVDDKAKIYVDMHAKRSTADMLKIVLNQDINARMAAIINFHLRVEQGEEDFICPETKRRPALDEVVAEMGESSYFINLLCDAMGNLGRAGTLAALFHYGRKYDEDTAIQLAEWVGTGENMTAEDPAYQLRNYLLTRAKRQYGGSAQLTDYKHAVYGCLAHAKGEKVNRLYQAHSWNGLPERKRAKVVRAKDVSAKPDLPEKAA